MWPNPQFPADWVTFTEEILNGKLLFFCSVIASTLPWLKFLSLSGVSTFWPFLTIILHRIYVQFYFSISDDVALKISFKAVEMCLQCITMADVVDNWSFDTIVLYKVFFSNDFKNTSLSSNSQRLKLLWGEAWQKLLVKNGKESYHLQECQTLQYFCQHAFVPFLSRLIQCPFYELRICTC